MRKVILCIAVVSALPSCDQTSASSEYEYSIDEDGAPERDVNRYESLGEKSAAIEQKYVLKLESPEEAASHYAVANITQLYGGKKVDEGKGSLIFIDDGRGEFNCARYVSDIPIATSDEEIPELKCEIEIKGFIPVSKARALTPPAAEN